MRLLSLSGFIPEQVCDTVRFTQYEGDFPISHYCGYVADFIAQVQNDPDIDGAVFPKSCDSSRGIAAYLSGSGKFLYQMPVPVCTGHAAVLYFAHAIRQYKEAVERHFCVRITQEEIRERALLVNMRNVKWKQWYDGLGEGVCYSGYLAAVHRMLKRPLAEQMPLMPQETMPGKDTAWNRPKGKRVYLVGSFLSDVVLAEQIERAGMCIVGDNLTESKRLFFAPEVEINQGDIYEGIARSILQNRASPTQNHFTGIWEDDWKEIQEKEAAGVIFLVQKYCEPYEYLYSVYRKLLEEVQIPVLKLNMANSMSQKRFGLELEAFAECL